MFVPVVSQLADHGTLTYSRICVVNGQFLILCINGYFAPIVFME